MITARLLRAPPEPVRARCGDRLGGVCGRRPSAPGDHRVRRAVGCPTPV